MTTKESIIAKIIVTKKGDIPDWVYENTNEDVMIHIINQMSLLYDPITRYPNIVNFCKLLAQHKSVRYSAIYEVLVGKNSINPGQILSVGLCLFDTRKQWFTFLHQLANAEKCEYTYGKYTYGELLEGTIRIAAMNCTQYANCDRKVKVLLRMLRKEVSKEFWYRAIVVAFFQNPEIEPFGYNADTMRLFLQIMNDTRFSHKDQYAQCLEYNLNGLPVLYYMPFCEVDTPILVAYLDCIIRYDYHIELDPKMSMILDSYSEIPDIVREQLYTIATTLHRNNLRYLDPIEANAPISTSYKLLFNEPNSSAIPITDFEVIRHQMENLLYCPIDIQSRFLEEGGNIRTMLDTGMNIALFADILRTQRYWEHIVRILDVEDVRYMLSHSVDFMMCAMDHYIYEYDVVVKLAKALFVYPVDKSLYKLINEYSVGSSDDYRCCLVLIQRMLRSVVAYSKQQLYMDVPEMMAYMQPSVLEFYTMMSINGIPTDHVKFIPASLISSYVREIIVRDEDYIAFNLPHTEVGDSILNFEDADTTHPLAEFIVKNVITKDERYAYICDIANIDPIQFIADIVATKNANEE